MTEKSHKHPRTEASRFHFEGERGFFAIGIYAPKTAENIGSLWRSALIFGAAFIFIIGRKYKRQASDVYATYQDIPLFQFKTFEDFLAQGTYDTRIVGVEMHDKAIALPSYSHLPRAIYILGSEDNGLPNHILDHCHELVQLPQGNFNVGNAGSIVMYDRWMKAQ